MADNAVVIVQQALKPIKLVKWKVNEGNSVSIGCVVLLYEVDDDDKHVICKLKSSQAGTVHKLLAQEGDVVKPGDGLLELQACTHPTVMRDMCAECGADLRIDDIITAASVPMVHSVPELKVSLEQAQKIGKADVDRLLKDRKLVLLVDLDQTLIHTTNDNIPANIKDVYHFQLYGAHSPWYHTRLRPGTHRFLENMSPFFELHICTFGARNYAHMIAMFLDQDGKLFSQRILSRDECFNPTSKTANLKALFPCGDDMVCIIDDREDVWSHAANLIHVKPYHFFQHTGDINAPPGLDKHESDDKEGVDFTKVNCDKKKIKVNGSIEENADIISEKLELEDGEINDENANNSTEKIQATKQEVINNVTDENTNIVKDKIEEDRLKEEIVDNVVEKMEQEDLKANSAQEKIDKINNQNEETDAKTITEQDDLSVINVDDTIKDDKMNDKTDPEDKTIITKKIQQEHLKVNNVQEKLVADEIIVKIDDEKINNVEEKMEQEEIKANNVQEKMEEDENVVKISNETDPKSEQISNVEEKMEQEEIKANNIQDKTEECEKIEVGEKTIKVIAKMEQDIQINNVKDKTEDEKINHKKLEDENSSRVIEKMAQDIKANNTNDKMVEDEKISKIIVKKLAEDEKSIKIPEKIEQDVKTHNVKDRIEVEIIDNKQAEDEKTIKAPEKIEHNVEDNVEDDKKITESETPIKVIERIEQDVKVNNLQDKIKVEMNPEDEKAINVNDEERINNEQVNQINDTKTQEDEKEIKVSDKMEEEKVVNVKENNVEDKLKSEDEKTNNVNDKLKSEDEKPTTDNCTESVENGKEDEPFEKEIRTDESIEENVEVQNDKEEIVQNNFKTFNDVDKDSEIKDELIEIDDPDDYLMYLEDILKIIHKTFYDKYDKLEAGKVPDLKKVIPEVRRNVLKDTKLVFSGLVPTHIKLEQSKAYQVARSLGAKVTQDLQETSTHLVAVRPGTAKVNAGRRKKNLKIVTPDWLWACAERWTKVEEKLYNLNNKGSKNRHPPPHCSSPEHKSTFEETTSRKRTPSGRFMDTINPLMSFSSADIADMDREVEDIFNESESDSEAPKKPTTNEVLLQELTKSCDEDSSTSEESLTSEHPHGWRPARAPKRPRDEDGDDESTADEFPSTKFRRGEQLSSDLDIGQESNSEGSVDAPDEIDDGDWNMMGAALEREFLANN